MPAGKKIKQALLERGMKQKELAEKLNISPITLSNTIRNDKINYNRVEEIAEILGYEIVWRDKKKEEQSQQNINNNGIMGIGIQNNNK